MLFCMTHAVDNLFSETEQAARSSVAPLAVRMRPCTLDETSVVGDTVSGLRREIGTAEKCLAVRDHLRDRHRSGSERHDVCRCPHDYPTGWVDQRLRILRRRAFPILDRTDLLHVASAFLP